MDTNDLEDRDVRYEGLYLRFAASDPRRSPLSTSMPPQTPRVRSRPSAFCKRHARVSPSFTRRTPSMWPFLLMAKLQKALKAPNLPLPAMSMRRTTQMLRHAPILLRPTCTNKRSCVRSFPESTSHACSICPHSWRFWALCSRHPPSRPSPRICPQAQGRAALMERHCWAKKALYLRERV